MSRRDHKRLLHARTFTRFYFSPWLDSLLLSVYAAGISALIILVQSVIEASPGGGRPSNDTSDLYPHSESQRRPLFRRSIDNPGGRTIFAFKFTQLLAILGLLGISLTQLVLQNQDAASRDYFGSIEIVQVTQCLLYVSCLCSMSMNRT